MPNATLTVSSQSAHERLDVFLSQQLPGFSRSKLQRLIEENGVLVNARPAKKNMRCMAGDRIEIIQSAGGALSRPSLDAQDIPLDIIYEDEYFLAVNKPAGMVVHPGNGNPDNTLVNALLYRIKNLSSGSEGDRPGIVHRLDKETSGLLLVAKTDSMHGELAAMFALRTIDKNYIGICFGHRPDSHGSIDLALGRNRREPVKRSVRTDGKNALTEYWCLEHERGVSVMRFKPHTGRTHQIRVHCSSRGFPIVADTLYGGGHEQMERISVLDRPFAYKVFKCFHRHALHAYAIAFKHPFTKEPMHLIAPFPADFEDAFRVIGFDPSKI